MTTNPAPPALSATILLVRDVPAFQVFLARRNYQIDFASGALVFPGGSIFQDVTSTRSVMYYAGLVKMAKKAGKKVVLLSQGVGPLNSFFGKKAAGGAFDMADAITVRDPKSAQVIKDLGVNKTVTVAGDMAFLLPRPPESAQDFGAAGMKVVGVAPRPWGKKADAISLYAELARMMSQKGMVPMMIPMRRR